MSTVVSQGACKYCGSSDANTVYDDGHEWCYSCRRYTPPTNTVENMHRRLQKKLEKNTITSSGKELRPLPNDVNPIINVQALRWLRSYGITDAEIKKHHLVWSDSREMLILPSYDSDMNLMYWQGRYFPSRSPKVHTEGDNNHIMLFPATQSRLDGTLVIVEDFVSAIKVKRVCDALCLFGSHVPPRLISRVIQQGYKSVVFWLDYNKAKDSMKFRDQYSVFLNTKSVVSPLDPKEYNTKDIEKYLLT
jgi:hypothetical protein